MLLGNVSLNDSSPTRHVSGNCAGSRALRSATIGRRSASACASVTPGFSRPSRCTLLTPSTTRAALEHDRHVDVRAAPHEALRHHADDRPDRVVEPQLPADDRRVAAELPLPEAIAEHDDRLGARRAVVGPDDVRPTSGGTPITSNVFGVPWLPRSRCGSPSPVHITSLIVEAIDAVEDRVPLGDLEELVGRVAGAATRAAPGSHTRTLIRLSTSL